MIYRTRAIHKWESLIFDVKDLESQAPLRKDEWDKEVLRKIIWKIQCELNNKFEFIVRGIKKFEYIEYVPWYKQRIYLHKDEQKFIEEEINNWLDFRFKVCRENINVFAYGSGMLVVLRI